MDYTVILQGRHQFGDRDLNEGVFVGREETWHFDCPKVAASQTALLLFQGRLVSSTHIIKINGAEVPGGIPTGPVSAGVTNLSTATDETSIHAHGLTVESFGWSAYVMLVGPNVLRASNNSITVIFQDPASGSPFADNPEFVIDNMVLLYKT